MVNSGGLINIPGETLFRFWQPLSCGTCSKIHTPRRIFGLPDYTQTRHACGCAAASIILSDATLVACTQVERLNITVEILVNAAGECQVGALETLDLETVQQQVDLNVLGTTLLTKLFATGRLRHMCAVRLRCVVDVFDERLTILTLALLMLTDDCALPYATSLARSDGVVHAMRYYRADCQRCFAHALITFRIALQTS